MLIFLGREKTKNSDSRGRNTVLITQREEYPEKLPDIPPHGTRNIDCARKRGRLLNNIAPQKITQVARIDLEL